MLDFRSYFLLFFTTPCLRILHVVAVQPSFASALLIHERQRFFFPLLFFMFLSSSLLRVMFACWVSEEDKSNNKEKLVASSTREAIYLTACIHIHTEQNRFLLQTKEKFLRPPFLSGSSPRNFISQCIHTNQYVITTAIYNRTNEGLKLEL